MKITFIDGYVREYDSPKSVLEIAESLSVSLKKKSIAGKINDELLVDVSHVISDDVKLEIITKDSKEAFEILNHSTAHLLAQTLKNLYPDAHHSRILLQ